jgi:hypothetical protein
MAFGTPTLRTKNYPLTTDRHLGGRPPDLYKKAQILLEDVALNRIEARTVLVEIVRLLLLYRDENLARIDSLLDMLKRKCAEGALPLSSEAIVTLISQHLNCKGSSRLPVMVVAAAYETAGAFLSERMLPLNLHCAADLQTGSIGDIEICLMDDDSVVTAYEMKIKPVTKNDIDAAVAKILRQPRVDNYLFVTTAAIDPLVAEYATTLYEITGGTEIAILDCIGFLRHFLHLFHRIRENYLNSYQ